ncbi:MAG: YibE/F family protein [Trueperaceae bacterium]
MFAFSLFSFLLPPSSLAQDIGYLEGKILELTDNGASVQLRDGTTIEADIGAGSLETEGVPPFRVGQHVEIYFSPSPEGGVQYVITDWIRRPALLWLTGLFLASVLVVAGFKGLRAFLATSLSLVIVIAFMLPQILAGWNPIFVSLLGVGGILLLAIYFVHGFNWSTTAALIGTYAAIIVTILLGLLFSEWAYLTGFGSEEAMMLSFSAEQVNLRGLLLAGLLIGTLGALTDITIVQASVVRELAYLNPKFGLWDLYRRGMNVGYDHVGSLVNTLVLAYTGAALPLFLLLSLNELSIGRALNLELVAGEVVHTLVGSIGLILAVPFTTFIAAFMFRGNRLAVTRRELEQVHH